MCVPSVILDSTGTVYHSRDCWGQDQCERRESDPSVSSTFYPCRKWKSTLTSWVEQSMWKWMRLLASTWPEFLLRWGNSMKLWLRRTVRMLRRGSSPRYSHTNEPHSSASALPPWQGPTALSQNDWFFNTFVCDFAVIFPFRLMNWTVKLPPTPSRYRPASQRSRNCAAPCRAWRSISSRSSAWYGAAPSTPQGTASHCPLPPLLSHLFSTPPPWDKLHSNLFWHYCSLESWAGGQPEGHGGPILRAAGSDPDPHHRRGGAAGRAPLWHGAPEPGVQNAHGHQESAGAGDRHLPPAAGGPGLTVCHCPSPDEQIGVTTHSGVGAVAARLTPECSVTTCTRSLWSTGRAGARQRPRAAITQAKSARQGCGGFENINATILTMMNYIRHQAPYMCLT